MQTMKKLRLWHALIALLAVAAYLSEDLPPVHQWLGYGVVGLIAVRLLMAVFGSRQLGLKRFYPHFHDLSLGTFATHPAVSRILLLGIAFSLLGVAATGVIMDQGKTLRSIPFATVGTALAQDGDDDAGSYQRRSFEDDDDDEEEGEDEGDESLGEIHEFFANLMLAMVALHVGYLVAFKWPLARFMLFIRQPRKPSPAKPAP